MIHAAGTNQHLHDCARRIEKRKRRRHTFQMHKQIVLYRDMTSLHVTYRKQIRGLSTNLKLNQLHYHRGPSSYNLRMRCFDRNTDSIKTYPLMTKISSMCVHIDICFLPLLFFVKSLICLDRSKPFRALNFYAVQKNFYQDNHKQNSFVC